MQGFSRVARIVGTALVLVIPSAGLAESAVSGPQAVTTPPANFEEWQGRLFAANTEPQGGITVVAAGGFHSCGITTTKTVMCWGDNEFGQTTAPAGTYTAVVAGTYHSCALATDQTIKCWGKADNGRTIPPTGKFTAIAAEAAHACGIRDQFKTITCWGYNSDGQTAAPTGVAFIAVSAGGFHSCGIKTTGKIACWGTIKAGPTGPATETFTSMSAGGLHSCAINQGKKIKCWGGNGDGQTNAPTGTFEFVDSGSTHACAKKSDQTLSCWGNYANGRTTVPSGAYNMVSAGRAHSCGVAVSRKVMCWGDNTNGQAVNQDIRTTSDPWVTQYVKNLETALNTESVAATNALNALTDERNKLLTAPVCELRTPSGLGKAKVGVTKTLGGTVRWSGSATGALASVTITRTLGGRVEYWNRPGKWTTTSVSRTISPASSTTGLKEAPWKLAFRVPATVGAVYTVTCNAVDNTTNSSPTADVAKMTGVA